MFLKKPLLDVMTSFNRLSKSDEIMGITTDLVHFFQNNPAVLLIKSQNIFILYSKFLLNFLRFSSYQERSVALKCGI